MPENQSPVRDAFLHINTCDSGEITTEELTVALPHLSAQEILSLMANCSQSHPDRITWSEF